MLERADSYEALYRDFRWEIPDRFNIGVAVADRWAAREPDRIALLEYRQNGEAQRLSYGELARQSNALANALKKRGISRGDRVALLLPQCFETVIAHVAIYKLGAIAVPLALLFGIEALEYRLQTAGVKAVITNQAGSTKVEGDPQPLARAGTGGFRRWCRRRQRRVSSNWWSTTSPCFMPKTRGRTIRR